MLAFQLIFMVIAGAICAAVASSKGRNAVGWFFIGFLTGLIGIILICVFSNLNAERRRFEEQTAERRRLKEQLRQERLKGESFRRYAATRLDTHDQVLGVDTRSPTELLGAGAPAGAPLPVLPRADAVPAPVSTPLWYYEKDGAPHGPLAGERMVALMRGGHVRPETLVWTETMAEWTPARDVPEFRGAGRPS